MSLGMAQEAVNLFLERLDRLIEELERIATALESQGETDG